MPAEVELAGAEVILEHLCQLAARLCLLSRQNQLDIDARSPAGTEILPRMTHKSIFIRRYIEARHGGKLKLTDMARELKVSEDRVTHMLRGQFPHFSGGSPVESSPASL